MTDMDEFRRFIILLQTEVRTRWLKVINRVTELTSGSVTLNE
jgi:hypothetical protein